MTAILHRHRGAALIVVLTVLFVLALLGTSILLLSSTDRTVAMNYLDQVRAGQLARSGVAAAVAALSADPFSPNLKYWGNDESESQEGGALDVPLDHALNPSLAIEQDGKPESGSNRTRRYTAVTADGRTITFGVSGFHSASAYDVDGDVYQLKITDASACLHLNDGAKQFGGNRSSVSQNLKRMLNVLGSLPTVKVPKLGDRILAARPAEGFGSITQVEQHFSHEEMRRFRPFVAVHNWVDKNVANPVPLSLEATRGYPVHYYRGNPLVYRRGRGASPDGGGQPLQWFDEGGSDPGKCAVYAMDEVNPSYIEIVHRAPVHVNAARREVLITLLTDLHGFFISERRAFAPYAPSSPSGRVGRRNYWWWNVRHTYDDKDSGQGPDGDEFGFIYRTLPVSPVGSGRTTSLFSAATIADHIIACRERRMLGGFSYRAAWFGGPFKTWSQFNRFVDNLVEIGVIQDHRTLFQDYDSGSWDNPAPRESKAGRKFASYAAADVLKANFNPNLHLNELNPDSNLFLRVDKTDLIVNSTEFSFMPTGVYEVESLGRVLKPTSGRRRGASIHTIEAQRRISASVRVFEPYRETSQRHFAGGRLAPKSEGTPPTSSGAALEIGPEPEVRTVNEDHFGNYVTTTSVQHDGYRGGIWGETSTRTGWGYEFDGYIGLSTLGGRDSKEAEGPCRPHWPVEEGWEREGMHVHFNGGFDAAYNSALPREEQASRSTVDGVLRCTNTPDVGAGPGPLWTGNGERGAHRLARSFRLPPAESRNTDLPALLSFAPGDLRLDGLYSERHAGAAYAMRQVPEKREGHDSCNFAFHGGVLSLWVKPSFFPEHTGKARNIVSMSKHHAQGREYRNPAPFNLMFLPAHDRPAYEEPAADELGRWGPPPDPPPRGGPHAPGCDYSEPFAGEERGGNIPIASRKTPTEQREHALGLWQIRPASFMAFRAATPADAGFASRVVKEPWEGEPVEIIDLENYAFTSCLNHNLHPHGLDTGSTPNPETGKSQLRPNYFEAHRWTHVILSWQVLPPVGPFMPSADHQLVIWVNGRPAEYLHGPEALQLYSEYAWGSRQAGTVVEEGPPRLPEWDFHAPGRANAIRLGEVSDLGLGPFPRNQSADMTLDEFHLWRVGVPFSLRDSPDETQDVLIRKEVVKLRNIAARQWAVGRYYRPKEDAAFISAPIQAPRVRRRLPRRVDAEQDRRTEREFEPSSKTRLIGFSWTWYPEEISRLDGRPMVLDYRPESMGAIGSNTKIEDGKNYPGDEAKPHPPSGLADLAPWKSAFTFNDDLEKLTPRTVKQVIPPVTVALRVTTPQGASTRGIRGDYGFFFIDAGFSIPRGGIVELGEEALQYEVRFQFEELKSDTILLGTPVFDDITFYFGLDEVEYLYWIGGDAPR